MSTENLNIINGFEEKFGKFNQVKSTTRRTCLGIDKLLECIGKRPLDLNHWISSKNILSN